MIFGNEFERGGVDNVYLKSWKRMTENIAYYIQHSNLVSRSQTTGT